MTVRITATAGFIGFHLRPATRVIFRRGAQLMKVPFYCQHVLGIGHLVRSGEIARVPSREDDVTFVRGGAPVDGVPIPRGGKLNLCPAERHWRRQGGL